MPGCRCKNDGSFERQVWERDMSLFVEEVCFMPVRKKWVMLKGSHVFRCSGYTMFPQK